MEHARIKSLSGLMENAGLPTLVYEDFAGMTFEILSKLSTLTPDMLLEKFCNPEYSDAIVMHFKVGFPPPREWRLGAIRRRVLICRCSF